MRSCYCMGVCPSPTSGEPALRRLFANVVSHDRYGEKAEMS